MNNELAHDLDRTMRRARLRTELRGLARMSPVIIIVVVFWGLVIWSVIA